MSFVRRLTPFLRTPARKALFVLLALGALPGIAAADFTVDDAGSDPDANLADTTCATSGGGCTLRAALQNANKAAGLDVITFSVTSITLTADLPDIMFPVTVDGSAGSPVILDGGRPSGGPGGFKCLVFLDTAEGSTVNDMNIRACGGAGISAVGYGYTFQDNLIGTNDQGDAAAGNGGDGISLTTVAEDWPYSTMLPVLAELDLATIEAAGPALLAGALARTPNTITGNTISGNEGNGIGINGENTALNVITANFVGTSSDGTAAIPNGTAGGTQHGIRIFGNAFGNFVGPFNVISGNSEPNSDGISIEGSVPWPNVVAGNIVGPSVTFVTDLGNAEAGIRVQASPSPAPSVMGDPPANPTPYSALIGPGNVVGYNQGGSSGSGENINNAVGGITVIGGTTRRVKVFGNFVGVAEFPLGLGFDGLGNFSDGINVSAPDNEIGGSLPFTANFVGANGLHGIAVRGGSSVVDNVVRGNVVGGILDGASMFLAFGNAQDGIFVPNAYQTTIGGPGPFDSNLVAGNGRNGIRIGAQSGGNGSSNWITQNKIYGNTMLGIDLNGVLNDPDSTTNDDPDSDANLGQNAPVLSAAVYDPNTGETAVSYSLHSAPNRPYLLEVYASDSGPDASGIVFLGVIPVLTDAMGDVSGTDAVTPLSPLDSGGYKITVTATDVSVGTRPDGSMGILDNTSEFSNAVTVPQPGQIRFTAATASLMAPESAGVVMFQVERINGSDGQVQVDYTISDGTAVAPGDYTAMAMGTLTWMDGEAGSKPIPVTIVSDLLDEPDETVLASIGNPTGGAVVVAPSMATLTIQDDDAEPTLSIGDFSTVEGNASTTSFTFMASIDAVSGKQVSFTASTADGTAMVSDNDYSPLSNVMFSIPAGTTSVPVVVDVIGDLVDEMADETFFVNLTSLVNAQAGDLTGQGTIVNDDAPTPTLSIDDPSVLEGAPMTTANLVFTVTRSSGTGSSTVDVTITGGTATGGGVDYDDLMPVPLTLAFSSGELTMPVTVVVRGDAADEPDETVEVTLSNPTGATIGDGLGVGTIQDDDDPVPDVTVNDPSVGEGTGGTVTLDFTLTRSSTAGASSVSVQTADGSATVAGNDYVAVPATQVDFVDGQAMATVSVTVISDDVFEGNETLFLNVSTVANANVTDNQGVGTIQDDDPQPTISIDDVSMNEGNAATTSFTFTVSLSNPSAQTVTVSAASADNTATLANLDYQQLMPSVVTFTPLDVEETVTVLVNGDTDVEPNETFFVNLSGPSNATILDGQGVGTIQNDDAAGPSFSIGDRSLAEGNAGSTAFSFDVTRTDTVGAVSVLASTADGSATAGSGDYAAVAGQLVSFVNGQATAQVVVQVTGDTIFEPNEGFVVNLSMPSAGYSIADGQGQGTIVNDDSQPTISVGDVSETEGNAGGKTFSFPVTLSNPSSQTVTVSAATADGSAMVAGADYLPAGPATVTFPPLSTAQAFPVTVQGDTAIEPDETFFVNLSAPSNGSIGDGQGVGTILNDDAANKVASGPSGTGSGTVTIAFTGGGVGCGFTSTDLLAAPPGAAPIPPTEPPPGGWIFPHGLVSFVIDGCTPASTLAFTINFPSALPAGTVIWKYGPTQAQPTDHWYQLPAVVSGNVVTFSIQDGGLGDSDLTANGTVSDPGGPAYLQTAPPASIPTIDWRGLMALLLALAALGAWLARGGVGRA